jgi:hypothetical protein
VGGVYQVQLQSVFFANNLTPYTQHATLQQVSSFEQAEFLVSPAMDVKILERVTRIHVAAYHAPKMKCNCVENKRK